MTWFSAHVGAPMGWAELVENVHGPLLSLVLHAWGAVAGDGEWAMRVPSAVFGTAMVPAMAWLSARWLGRETAPAAAWLTAASPFLVWYSQEARNYALLMLCVCVSAAVLLDLRRRMSGSGVVAYLATAAAGMLSNLSFVFLAPLHLRWWLAAPGPRGPRLRALGVIAAALAIVALPWLLQATRLWDWSRLSPARQTTAQESSLRGETTFHPGAVPFALHSFAVGYTLGPPLREMRSRGPWAATRSHLPEVVTSGVLFGALALWGLRALRRRGRLTDAVLWMVLPAAVLSYLAVQNFKVFHPRYLAVSAPAFMLLLAAAFTDLRPRARVACAVAVALLWGASLRNHYFDPAYGKEDFRAAAAWVRTHAGPGEQVLAVYTEDQMSYYLRDTLPIRGLWLGLVSEPDRLRGRLDAAVGRANGTWIVLSRAEVMDPQDVFANMAGTRYPHTTAFSWEGVRVWHVPGPGDAPATEGASEHD